MPGEPNPEAIAWYVKRSEELFDDLSEGVGELRTRGGQLAGFSGAVPALAGANVPSILDALDSVTRTCAGVSLLLGVLLLVDAIELITIQADQAARAMSNAKFVGPVKPDPPPWDVPLDQTRAPIHIRGDVTSV